VTPDRTRNVPAPPDGDAIQLTKREGPQPPAAAPRPPWWKRWPASFHVALTWPRDQLFGKIKDFYETAGKRFRACIEGEVALRLRKGVDQFKEAELLTEEEKGRFELRFTMHQTNLARAAVWHETIGTVFLAVLIVGFIGCFCAALAVSWQLLAPFQSPGRSLMFVLGVVGTIATGYLTLAPVLVSSWVRRFVPRLSEPLFALLGTFTVTVCYAWALYALIGEAADRGDGPAKPWEVLAITALLGGFVFGVFILLALVLVILAAIVLENWRRSRHPDAVLVEKLWKIVWLIDGEPSWFWLLLSVRVRLVSLLEEAALCLERDLCRKFRSGDPVIDEWIDTRGGQMAAEVRSYKKWLFTPMPSTQHEFANMAKRMFLCALSGEWDSFPRDEQYKRGSTGQTFRVWLLNATKHLLVGAVPLAAVLTLPWANAELAGPIRDSLVLAAGVWAVVNVLLVLDSRLAERVSLAKDIFSMFRFGQGKDKPDDE
jgi:hypothetical protein